MQIENKKILHTDILIVGGGTAGCYAALTIREKSDYSIIIAEKANIIKIGDLELDKDSKEVRVNGEPVKLTATEYGILQLLMENAGKVFSIDEIYEKVWNEPFINSENTVAVHIRRIREKIEVDPKEPMYLKVVWGIGYKIEKHGR